MATNYNISGMSFNIDTTPDECPVCSIKVSPTMVHSGLNKNNDDLEVIFKCTNNKCDKFFISYYDKNYSNGIYYFQNSKPKLFKIYKFSQEIEKVSSEFVIIYNQALAAENQNLDRIAGVGYRKALEFLIKDYCVSIASEDKKDSILKKNLTQVIKQDLINQKISKFAEKAVWLGNDETHYIKKWEMKDIEDLKLLISIVVDNIDQELKGEKLLKSLNLNIN